MVIIIMLIHQVGQSYPLSGSHLNLLISYCKGNAPNEADLCPEYSHSL